MSVVKNIQVKSIHSSLANAFVKKHHYSGKVVPNSQLHFGCYLDDKLHGVMQFGPSINKRGTINLVAGTKWNEFIELNRMAFDDTLPKNSESRCIGIVIRLIKKHTPHIKWIISFADATQCGDGTIYRASGFKLVGIAPNTNLRKDPSTGENMHIIQAHHKKISKEFRSWQPLQGNQIKYIYLIDKSLVINKKVLDFNEIDRQSAGMYRGKKITLQERKVI